MSDYSRITNFTAKDSLPTGNPSKKVKGEEIQDELDAIATMSATKANKLTSGITENDVFLVGATGDLKTSGVQWNTVILTTGAQSLDSKSLYNVKALELDAGVGMLFEGATEDTYETLLTVEDPTADRTVTIPNATGTVVLESHTQTLTNKTIGGVVDTNLVDKSASETIAGDWNFTGTVTHDSNTITYLKYLGSAVQLVNASTTTGAWTAIDVSLFTTPPTNATHALISVATSANGSVGTVTTHSAVRRANTYFEQVVTGFACPTSETVYDGGECLVEVDGNGDFEWYTEGDGDGVITTSIYIKAWLMKTL